MFRKFDFVLKGEYIGFCIVFHKSDNLVSVKTLSGTKKQLEDEFYEYRKTLKPSDLTLEYKVIKNYDTISKDYIKTRVNRFIDQTKQITDFNKNCLEIFPPVSRRFLLSLNRFT